MTASKIGGWALRVYASVAAFALTSCGSNVQIAPGLTRDAGVDVVRQLGLHPSSGSESVLFSFTGAGGQLPGANPTSGLTLIEKNGENYLYGAAPMGGNEKVGTIYDLHGKAHHYVAGTLRAFSGKDGAFPYGSVSVPDPNGDNIYETTESGGRSDDGALIELILSNNKYKEVLIHSFAIGDGAQPYAGLTPAAGGVFFGTTLAGGSAGDGTLYELKPHGTGYAFTSIYSFRGGAGGKYPYAPVIVDGLGDLFGTTTDGGGKNEGAVFELIPKQSKLTILHGFVGGSKDGAYPYAGVIKDAKGSLFGTTINGGNSNFGVVFEVQRSGSHYRESVLYSFGSGSDGEYPYGGLLLGAGGVLFGTTENGGT
jgi:uncharacterized repeat protein (TIGR03803 family)